MDSTVYDSNRLRILYEMFRHKVAHRSRPTETSNHMDR
jgi:hypothetical protein